MSTWNAKHYLKYGDDRTRPAIDLAARIRIDRPAVIADLGCGPGNSTQILRDRWPQSKIFGIDNSPQMIEAAKLAYPEHNWLLADVSQWTPSVPVDLVFSNAALQWIPDHGALLPRLLSTVAPGGAQAFQIPSGTFATVRTIIHEISQRPAWSERMSGARNALTMQSPAFYYDALAKISTHLDIWETEYSHVLENAAAIVDWMSSTGLRPFLAALNTDAERNDFTSELLQRVRDAYPIRADGKVLFPFRRTFVIAYR